MQFLGQGLTLMVVGMGTVFAFLTVMYFWVGISARLAEKFAHLLPDDEKPAPRRSPKKTEPAPQAQLHPAAGYAGQPQLAAVISAAVQAYRRDHDLL